MIKDFDINNFSLFERQSKFYNAFLCPYCYSESQFIDSIDVYKNTSYGMMFICRKCDAYVGCHSGTDKSYGTLAKKELRDARHTCHLKFDPLCNAKVLQGAKKKTAKAAGYNWLAKVLNIDPVTCHIGYFNLEHCKKVIAACDKVYAEVELKNKIAKERAELVLVLGGYIGFEVTKFEMNGLLQLELVNHNNNKFIYFPRSNEGRWIKEKKVKPIEDIEQFIKLNFQ